MYDEFFATKPEYRAVEAVIRIGSVKRWHMLDTSQTQTLAAHSANVSLLAMVVAATAPGMFFGPSHVVAVAALLHDIGEVFSGDIPTPTKRVESGAIGRKIDELESVLTPAVLTMYKPDERVAWLVKICDLADGIRFIRMHGQGITAKHALSGLQEQMIAKGMEAVDCGYPEEVVKHAIRMVHFYAYEGS